MRRSRWRSLFVGIVAFSFVGTSAVAQVATPEPVLPERTAPYGLGEMELPDDAESIWAVFEQLPVVVGGEVVSLVEPTSPFSRSFTVGYGDYSRRGFIQQCMVFFVLDVTTALGGPPYRTAEDVVVDWSGSSPPDEDGFGMIVEGAGRDGELVWGQDVSMSWIMRIDADNPADPPVPVPMFEMRWGIASSPWVFTALATTPEDRDALVAAFVTAAGGTPEAPVSNEDVATPVAEDRC